MNNHEDQKKQTYESYTFQALMSFSVAYYATCVTYFSCPKKGCTYTRAEQSTKLSGLCLL